MKGLCARMAKSYILLPLAFFWLVITPECREHFCTNCSWCLSVLSIWVFANLSLVLCECVDVEEEAV